MENIYFATITATNWKINNNKFFNIFALDTNSRENVAGARRYFAPGGYHILELFNCPLKWAYNSIPVVLFTWNCMAFITNNSTYISTVFYNNSELFLLKQLNNNSAVSCKCGTVFIIHLIYIVGYTYKGKTTNKQKKAHTMSCIKPLNWCCLLHLDAIDANNKNMFFFLLHIAG